MDWIVKNHKSYIDAKRGIANVIDEDFFGDKGVVFVTRCVPTCARTGLVLIERSF